MKIENYKSHREVDVVDRCNDEGVAEQVQSRNISNMPPKCYLFERRTGLIITKRMTC